MRVRPRRAFGVPVRNIVSMPKAPQPDMMSKAANLATSAYRMYNAARKNPKYSPYIRKAERYVSSKFRSALERKAVLIPKMKFSTASATPGEISYSSFRRGVYKPPYFKSAIKTSQKYIYNECNSAHTAFPIGNQGVNDICIMRGKIMRQLAERARLVFGGGTSVNSNNYTVWFGTIKTTIRFSNPGLSTVSVDLYNYEARRDMNDDTVGAPTSLLSTWKWGANYEEVLGGYNPYNLGASPLDINVSGIYWNILKKTTIQLPPGSEHIHVVTQNINRKYNTIMDLNLSLIEDTFDASHVGYTHGVLICPSGAVVYDNADISKVDTSGGGLNYVYDIRYEIFNNSGSQPTVEYADNTAVVTAPKIVVVQNPTQITP